MGKFTQADAAAISAHYGSVSAVTFVVGLAFLSDMDEYSEGYMALIMALMEIPALVTGTILARAGAGGEKNQWGKLMHEILTGTSLYLMLGGVLIGYYAGVPENVAPLDKMFMDLFMGVLAFFLLEMGLLASARLKAVMQKAYSSYCLVYFPSNSWSVRCLLGMVIWLVDGGTMLLAVLHASCSCSDAQCGA